VAISTQKWQPKVIRRFIKSFPTGAEVVIVETDQGRGYLKALGNRAGPHALACEWVGTSLAGLLGLSTLDFALIDVVQKMRSLLRRVVWRRSEKRLLHGPKRATPGVEKQPSLTSLLIPKTLADWSFLTLGLLIVIVILQRGPDDTQIGITFFCRATAPLGASLY
jgi:hypothetical protein